MFSHGDLGADDGAGDQIFMRHEFRFGHHAEADAALHRHPNRFTAADLDAPLKHNLLFGQGLFEGEAGGRAHLAQDHALGGDLREGDLPLARQGVIAPHEDDDAVAAVGNGNKARVVRHLGQHRHIGAKIQQALEHLFGVADGHCQLQVGIAGAQRAQHLCDMIGADGADLQVPGMEAAKRVQIIHGLGLLRHHPPGYGEEPASRFGEGDTATPAMEEFDAIVLLERADLAGDGWLADVEDVGGRGEAALGGHRVEGSDLCVKHRFFQ